jgi:ABC-type nitrate/sulfonate/bicarbonate transport system substrate-binding protein
MLDRLTPRPLLGAHLQQWITLAIAVVAMLVWAGAAHAQAKPKVVIGVGIDATYGEIFVAIDKGFFAKQGIDAEF